MSDSPGTQFGGPRRKRSADTFGTWFCEARPKGSTDPNAWSTWTQQAGTPRTDISTDPGGTSGQVHTFYDTRVGMEYRFRQTTAKGVVIPSQVASLSGSASGYCNWVVNSLDAGSGVVALRACAVDSLNRVVGIGYLSGSVALGGITINSSGGAAFIMRIMPDGTVDLFKRLAVNDLGSVARGVAIDSQGRITVVGGFNNTIDFGNGKVLVGTLDTSNGSPGDIFVAQFDSNANVLWANAYAPPAGRLSNSNCTGSCVARNTDDSLTVAAWISQSVTFGSVTLNAGIQSDVALFKLSPDGRTVVWATLVAGASDEIDRPYGIAIDNSDNVYVTGRCGRSFNPGGGALNSDVFFAIFNSAGRYVNGSQRGVSVGINADAGSNLGVAVNRTTGDYYWSGTAVAGTQFGNGLSIASEGAFVAAYNSSSVCQWVDGFGVASYPSQGADTGRALAVDGNGNIAASGEMPITGSFDGLQSAIGHYVISIFPSGASAGKINWQVSYTGNGSKSGNQGPQTLAVDGLGNVVALGIFQNTVNFGSGKQVTVGSNTQLFAAQYVA